MARKLKVAQVLALKSSSSEDKKAAAAIMGRKGGMIGGPARANKLKSSVLYDIAVHAANKRWGQKCFKCPYCDREADA